MSLEDEHRRGDRGRPRGHVALSRFAVVAGLGWSLDAGILFAATRFFHDRPGAANMISSLTAASFVYLVSHRLVHRGPPDFISARLAAYVVYTIGLVTTFSLLLDLFARMFMPTLGAAAVLAAKIAITPPQFLCNFLVSRRLAVREIRRAT